MQTWSSRKLSPAMIALVITAVSARSQPDFVWSIAGDGEWDEAANWAASEYPRCVSVCADCDQTVTLPGVAPYTVRLFSEHVRLHRVAIENRNARVLLDSGGIDVCDRIDGPGTIVLSGRGNIWMSGPDTTLNAPVRIAAAANLYDAKVQFDYVTGTSSRLGPAGIITGRGTIIGTPQVDGVISSGPGDHILFGGDFRGLGVIRGDGGKFTFGNSTFSNIAFDGDIRVEPYDILKLGNGVLKLGPPFEIGDGVYDNYYNIPTIELADGVTLDAEVHLNARRAPGPPDPIYGGPVTRGATIQGPTTPGALAVLGPRSRISGVGYFNGFLRFEGVVSAGPGGQIDMLIGGRVVTGTGEFREDGGQIFWRNHTFERITLGGVITVDPGEALHVGHDVVFTDPPVIVGDPGVTRDTFLELLPGVTLAAPVHLNARTPPSARLRGPVTGTGSNATLSKEVTVSGTGVLAGRLVCDGCSLSPGHGTEAGILEIRAPLDFAFSVGSALTIDLVSEADFDRITGTAPKRLDGTLVVRLASGFAPAFGDTFEFLSGSEVTGGFDSLQTPAMPDPALHFVLRVTAEHAALVVTCRADLNADLAVDSADLDGFIAAFSAGDAGADLTEDGQVDSGDLQAFLFLFFGSCP